jgi:hypothetical protein
MPSFEFRANRFIFAHNLTMCPIARDPSYLYVGLEAHAPFSSFPNIA